MNIDQYQQKAAEFAAYDYPDYTLVALFEEVGELAGKYAKFMRKCSASAVDAIEDVRDRSAKSLREDVIKEMGDIAWVLVMLAHENDIAMSEVLAYNIEKLTDRKNRNVIIGEGDNR